MKNSAHENPKKSAKRQAAIKRELVRLSYQTKELENFYETDKWIKKAVDRFTRSYTVRPQIKEELRNVATAYVKEQWQKDKQAGKAITGGLVLRMTLRCLRKHAASDRTVLSYPHPERSTKKEETQRLAEITEKKLTWREREFQQTLRIDFRTVENELAFEGQNVLDGRMNGATNEEIRERLETLGYRNSKRIIYNQLEIIRESFKERGY